MSHKKQIVTIQQVTREKVMALLAWDALQLGNYQMQQAEAYLTTNIGADSYAVQQIRQSASFWAWWRNHWHRRDMDFVEEVKHMDIAELRSYYHITHSVEAFNYTPHRAIMEHIFATDVINPLRGRKPADRKVKL